MEHQSEMLLVVGGSFGLREFTQIRYDAQKIKKKERCSPSDSSMKVMCVHVAPPLQSGQTAGQLLGGAHGC
ncbi:hypothetical protein NFI96_005662 [Prochilodus magdalenae]|nr:hypothetical protein NFI96_005662 [Prochilodus magdalenae]